MSNLKHDENHESLAKDLVIDELDDALKSKLTDTQSIDELDATTIASVMHPERLQQILANAEAFLQVNSENLDDF